MLNKRFWLIPLIVLVSISSVVVFWTTLQQATSPQNPGVSDVKEGFMGSDEFIGMVIKVPGAEKNGYWELHVNKFKSLDDVGRLDKIEGKYFINKKPVYWISGKTGIIYWKNRILQVNGSVIFKTYDDSKKITADKVVWDPNQKVVLAQDQVIISTPALSVNTDGFKSNLNLNQMVFTGLTKIFYQRENHD